MQLSSFLVVLKVVENFTPNGVLLFKRTHYSAP
jgi:hypothetical protein